VVCSKLDMDSLGKKGREEGSACVLHLLGGRGGRGDGGDGGGG